MKQLDNQFIIISIIGKVMFLLKLVIPDSIISKTTSGYGSEGSRVEFKLFDSFII